MDEPEQAWAAEDFLDRPNIVVIADLPIRHGVLLMRFASDEAEILTLAVILDARRQGLGRALLDRALSVARERGAARLFLEVRLGNRAARALYAAAGFAETGRRRDYYAVPGGGREDALILVNPLVGDAA
ncbi:MAG: GNAT family N-acetyltransferase [Pseudomonadota bacterium]